VSGSLRRDSVPTVLIEDLDINCQVTVIISELYEEAPEPNPPAEMPEDQERENIWLVSKKAAD
jgi:hypothetical protein